MKQLEQWKLTLADVPRPTADLDKGFNTDDIKTLSNFELYKPSDVFKLVSRQERDLDDYNKNVNKMIQMIGLHKAHLSTSKTARKKNVDKIDELTKRINYYKDIGIE